MIPNAPDFAKLVPGFDFLQGLVKNAGSVLPGIGQWVAPTLNPEELEKRIEELRTVQFWLEQNARMLGATIQALEVQRMTLSTLQTMNVQVADLRDSLRIKPQEEAPAPVRPRFEMPGFPLPAAPAAASEDDADREDVEREKADDGAPAPAAAPAVVDPTQWWGALTKQFTELAANAMKDAAAESARQMAGGLVKQGFGVADSAIKAGMAPARKAAKVAGGVANKVAHSAAKARSARRAGHGLTEAAAGAAATTAKTAAKTATKTTTKTAAKKAPPRSASKSAAKPAAGASAQAAGGARVRPSPAPARPRDKR